MKDPLNPADLDDCCIQTYNATAPDQGVAREHDLIPCPGCDSGLIFHAGSWKKGKNVDWETVKSV